MEMDGIHHTNFEKKTDHKIFFKKSYLLYMVLFICLLLTCFRRLYLFSLVKLIFCPKYLEVYL